MAYAGNINGFNPGSQMILYVDDCRLSGPYKVTMLVTCALDVDNHLFNFYIHIVSYDSIKD